MKWTIHGRGRRRGKGTANACFYRSAVLWHAKSKNEKPLSYDLYVENRINLVKNGILYISKTALQEVSYTTDSLIYHTNITK